MTEICVLYQSETNLLMKTVMAILLTILGLVYVQYWTHVVPWMGPIQIVMHFRQWNPYWYPTKVPSLFGHNGSVLSTSLSHVRPVWDQKISCFTSDDGILIGKSWRSHLLFTIMHQFVAPVCLMWDPYIIPKYLVAL